MMAIRREHLAGRARDDGSSVGDISCGFRKEIVALFGRGSVTHVFGQCILMTTTQHLTIYVLSCSSLLYSGNGIILSKIILVM